MVERKIEYTEVAAEALGYDWNVVQFFLEKYPDLLEVMWSNGSTHYTAILNNTIENSSLSNSVVLQISLNQRYGFVAQASMAMLEFRGVFESQ